MLDQRSSGHASAFPDKKSMPDDLRLLFDAVAPERPAGLDAVVIAAEGVAGQGEADAALVLPDVSHFVNEQALGAEVAVAEIVAVELGLRVEVEVAGRGHDGVAGLEGEPLLAADGDTRRVDRVAKDGPRERDFGRG